MDVIIRVLAVTLLYFFLWDATTGHPLRTHCHIHRYKSVPPSTMSQVKELQSLYENTKNKLKCHHGLRLKNFPNCDIQRMRSKWRYLTLQHDPFHQSNERLVFTQHKVSLAVKVLDNITRTSLVNQNLETFSILQTDLSKCEVTKSPEMELCQHDLNKYTERMSAECLQRDVLLSLVSILVEDLGSLIHWKSHEKKPRRLDSQSPPARPAPKKHKGRKKPKANKVKAKSPS